MYTLYTSPTPNGWKASITLEELGLDYEIVPINLLANEQKDPEYRRLNPNGKIPTLVDHDEDDFAIFESGAILLYLAEKEGKLIPTDRRGRSEVVQWLMFQMGNLGPMMGQANVFFRYFPEKLPAAIERYHREGRRLMEVLDERLEGREFLCGEYSIADIANWSWAHTYKWSGIDVSGLENLKRWRKTLRERPAVQRGRSVPAGFDTSNVDPEAFSKGARSILS